LLKPSPCRPSERDIHPGDSLKHLLGVGIAELRFYPLRRFRTYPFHAFQKLGQGKNAGAVVHHVARRQDRLVMRDPVSQKLNGFKAFVNQRPVAAGIR